MKVQLKIWAVVLFLAVFVSGCGCGGGEGGGGETPAVLVSIEVTPALPNIAVGANQPFTATGIFSDNSSQDLTNSVVWSSSDNSIASISNTEGSKGLATGVAAGSTSIIATSGSVSGSTTLTVTAAVLASITVTPPNPSIAKGTQQPFTAIGTFTDNTMQDITGSVVWSSSDNSIASISNTEGSKGLATGVAAGSTGIIATSGSVSGNATLTVTAAVLASITVTPPNLSIAKGTQQPFTAMGTFSDNTMQDITGSVVWSSSDNSIATISNASGSTGLATGIAAGSAGIIATSGSVSGNATLTVTAVDLVSITVIPANVYVGYHTAVQYTAIGHYSDNTTQDITQLVIWSSSNTSVATISNAPGSKGLATTDGAIGITVITATLGNISGSTKLIDP